MVDYYEEGEDLYLLLKRVEGITLMEVLEKKANEANEDPERFSRLILKIFYQLATALAGMAKKKVFH